MIKKENVFFLLILLGLFFSLFNTFYQVEFFDNFRFNSVEVKTHSMVTGDILSFWREILSRRQSLHDFGGRSCRP